MGPAGRRLRYVPTTATMSLASLTCFTSCWERPSFKVYHRPGRAPTVETVLQARRVPRGSCDRHPALTQASVGMPRLGRHRIENEPGTTTETEESGRGGGCR